MKKLFFHVWVNYAFNWCCFIVNVKKWLRKTFCPLPWFCVNTFITILVAYSVPVHGLCTSCIHFEGGNHFWPAFFQHFIVHLNTLNNSTTEICNDNGWGTEKVNLKCRSARVSNLLPTRVFIVEQAISISEDGPVKTDWRDLWPPHAAGV